MAELSKIQLKIVKILTKYSPILIGILYFIASILSCFGIESVLIGLVGTLSFIPFLCLIGFSILFKYCIWHRLPLYYSEIINVISAVDYYFIIPVSNGIMLMFYVLLAGLFVILAAYYKNKWNERHEIDRTRTGNNSE